MANVMIVHDDSTFSRVAFLLEQHKKRIKLFERILKSKPLELPFEYQGVNRDRIRVELDSERWALQDLLEDIEEGLLVRELKQIEADYARSKEDEL